MIHPTKLDRLLEESPSTWRRWLVIAVAPLITLVDGYDGAAIGFAAPGIAGEWLVGHATLGLLLSTEVAGIALGCLLFGVLADHRGRRPALLLCLCFVTAGMAWGGAASSVIELSAARIVTGVGIGGVIVALPPLVAEYTNKQHRALVISMTLIGFPFGAAMGGLVAKYLLIGADWRAVFSFGAAITLFIIPVVWWVIPESPQWLNLRRPTNTLERINQALKRLDLPRLEALPELALIPVKPSLREIFSPKIRLTTILFTAALVLHSGCFYVLVKWLPKGLVDAGMSPSEGALMISWLMVGAIAGAATCGLLSLRFNTWRTVLAALACFSIALMTFSQPAVGSYWLILLVAGIGLVGNVVSVGIVALQASHFPLALRATGIGFTTGIGRLGATLGPVLVGAILSNGTSFMTVVALMAFVPMITLFAIWLLPRVD